MQEAKSTLEFYHLKMKHLSLPSLPDFTMAPSNIQLLFHQFSHLFKDPQQLLAIRSISHQIQLLPNSILMNVRPYRYPHFIKMK